MSNILIYDTETTGLPNFKAPLDDPSQPHIVQLAAVLVTPDKEIVKTMNRLIKPEGWDYIDPAAERTHGHSIEKLRESGIPIAEALAEIDEMARAAAISVAHNISFDIRMINRESNGGTHLRTLPRFCTMKESGYGTYIKLGELYKKLHGKPFNGASHDALNDVMACMECYFAIKERKLDQAEALPVF